MMASESCRNALVIIENQENLGFGTWEKPGNKPSKKPSKIPGKNLVKNLVFFLASQETWECTIPAHSP